MKKRLFAMLLTLCMVMALLPTAVFAEEAAETVIEVSTAAELQTAVNDAANNTTVRIQLTANIDTGNTCALSVPEFKEICLDLNGHNITSAATNTIYVEYPSFLGICGAGTVSNTADSNAATIHASGFVTVGNNNSTAQPIITCKQGNTALKGHTNTVIEGGEFFGYVDSYSSLFCIYGGTFHSAVRSCLDSYPGYITILGGMLKGGVIFNFTEDTLGDTVSEKEILISINGGTVSGDLRAVGNATFQVARGNFEKPVAEDLLYYHEYDDGSKYERVCVERKDADGNTYYSVVEKTNKIFSSVDGNRTEVGVTEQEFESVIVSSKNEYYTIKFGGYSGRGFDHILYAAENTTVNGTPITIEWDREDHFEVYAEVPLETGNNDLVIRCEATDGTEYTYYLTVIRKAADGEEPFVEVSDADELQQIVDDNTISYIKLTDDIDADDYYALSVPTGKEVVLFLNGHDITSEAEYTIFVENRGQLTVKGKGTIANTAESDAVTIRNDGNLKLTDTKGEEQNWYFPSVVCETGNVAIENYGIADIYAEEVIGFVDSYGGGLYIDSGIFHDAVRSCIDSESERKVPGRIGIYEAIYSLNTVLEDGIIYHFNPEELDTELVTEPTAFITIYSGTISGEIAAVGNAIFEISGGKYENRVAEEFLSCYEYDDGSKNEFVCVERKDAEGKTYYHVLPKSNRPLSRIMVMLYWFCPVAGETSQDFGTIDAYTNESLRISIGASEIDLTAAEVYMVENTTVNGKPLTMSYLDNNDPHEGYIDLPLEYGDNKVEIKTVTTDGTEYTLTFTLTRKEAPAPTPNRPSTSTTPNTPSTGTVTKPDGSTVTTDRDTTGSRSETVVDKNGVQTTEVTVTNAAIRNAAAAGESVALPMPAATATKDSATAPSVTVDLPSGVKTAKVEIPVENVTAGTVAVIVHADGTEEIVPYSIPTEDGIELTVENGATVKIVDNSRDFTDVSTAHTFSDAVDFASARGIVEGYGNGSFGVGSPATSAATVTVIARIMGEDFYGTGATTKAQDWAKENGIAAGLDLSGNVTRGDFMVMLWRAASCPAASASDVDFADASGLSAIEQAAFAWAVENGVISGYGDGTVRPDAHITRGAMAAIAQRYMTR